MIELYLDTVDVEQVKRFSSCLPVRGVTTNPSILANAGVGVNQVLPEIADVLGKDARFHVQVVSQSVNDIVEEAKKINELPFDMVVKIPATESGLAAIKQIKQYEINVLATAIYSTQQGICAAFSGADYLAPYVNRMDTMGNNGVAVVADLQKLLTLYHLDCKLLPASFKNTLQVMEMLKQGVGAITLPVDVAELMVSHPAAISAVDKFDLDWRTNFGDKLSYQS